MCDLDLGIIGTGMNYRQVVSALRKIGGFAQSYSIPSYDRHLRSYSVPLDAQLSDSQLAAVVNSMSVPIIVQSFIGNLAANLLGRFVQPTYVPMARLNVKVQPDDSVSLRVEGDLAVGRKFLRVPADYNNLPLFCSDLQTPEQKDALNDLASRVAGVVDGLRR